MQLFARPSTVKVRLACAGKDEEVRKVELPQGNATTFSAALSLFEERFGQPLLPRFCYQDEDGDVVTITTDAEFRAVIAAGVRVLKVTAAPVPCGAPAGWELVDIPEEVSTVQSVDATKWSNSIRFWLNGEEQVVKNPSPSLFLVDWLREDKLLMGTKIGCHEGGCGACTVAIAFPGEAGGVHQRAVTSCLRRLCSLDGCHVMTTEGIGSKDGGFNAVQKAIADGNGSQCGYCTPGWVMNMYALLQGKAAPTRREIEDNFDGNLCRCTGFRPILSAFGEFADGGRCCGKTERIQIPAEVASYKSMPLHFVDHTTGEEWYRPVALGQIHYIKAQAKSQGKRLRYICAFTTQGVEKYFPQSASSNEGAVYLDITCIPDLQGVSFTEGGLTCGSTVPIAQVISNLEQHTSQIPAYLHIVEHLKRVASVQIRSVGSWAGNLMFTRENPTFQSDAATVLATAGAVITVVIGADFATKVQVSVPELFALKGDVLVLSMRIPALPKTASLWTYKTAQRSAFADAIVNMGTFFDIENAVVAEARIFVAGATETLLNATKTVAAIVGKHLDQACFATASKTLLDEIRECPSTDPLNTSAYRETLALSFLYKAFLAGQPSLSSTLSSAIVPFIPAAARPISSGSNSYGVVPSDDPVGTWVPKLSSRIQASGENAYTSDSGRGALVGQVVFSTAANAKLVLLNPAEALEMAGVVAFIGADAIPGKNNTGSGPDDKVFFDVGDQIPCVGAQLGMVVAKTFAQAHAAAKRVRQVYSPAGGALIATTEEAREAGYTAKPADLTHAAASLKNSAVLARRGLKTECSELHINGVDHQEGPSRVEADQHLKATFKTGGQYHFYMETQCTVARPLDGDNWEICISDQDPSRSQSVLALVLGIPLHNINCVLRHAGGGFGGKIMRQIPLAAACAVAARKLRQPVLAQHERLDDMRTVCGREPTNFDYEVTFDASGKVDTMDLTIDFYPGWFYGDAIGDAAMCQQFSDNCYYYNVYKSKINPILTGTPHTTPMRAPGAMQSIIWSDIVMEHIAKTVGKPLEDIQQLNFYKPNDKTPFGDQIGQHGFNWTIPKLWKQIQKDADYAARKEAVQKYNQANRWIKRGIAMSPVKYIAGLNGYQCGATVNVYGDGTVLVNHGGCEIGQGINTVAALCAAQTLGIPVEKIAIGRTETAKVPNNTTTGGSGTTEAVSQAVTLACKDIAERVAKVRKPGMTWEEAVQEAITGGSSMRGTSLLASSWFQAANTGNADTYATYGVCVGEAQVDVLTGEVRVERVDILMDLGTQLDAAVDIGQVEGGFVQALGYLLSEEFGVVNAKGESLNIGTWNYKIPGAYDIPVVFNCSLLKDTPNPVGIRGSKMCAEPAMGLCSSVYFAVKEAMYAARKDAGLGDDWFMLDLPITPQRVCMAIGTPEDKLKIPSQ